MSFLSPNVRMIFDRWQQRDICVSLNDLHQQFIERRADQIQIPDPEVYGPADQAAFGCLLLRQALLHRGERLLLSTSTMLLEGNVYGIALLVRGHLEATAVLGYFCHRLAALEAGNITFEMFYSSVFQATNGARDKNVFKKAPRAIHINECMDKANKYIDKNLFQKKTDALQESYDWLSEYAHPNFLSNNSSFYVDKENKIFTFKHKNAMDKDGMELFVELDLSCVCFVYLFDAFYQRSTSNRLSSLASDRSPSRPAEGN